MNVFSRIHKYRPTPPPSRNPYLLTRCIDIGTHATRTTPPPSHACNAHHSTFSPRPYPRASSTTIFTVHLALFADYIHLALLHDSTISFCELGLWVRVNVSGSVNSNHNHNPKHIYNPNPNPTLTLILTLTLNLPRP